MRLAMVFMLRMTSPSFLNQPCNTANTVFADLTPGLVPPKTKLGHQGKRGSMPRLRYVQDSGMCETRKGMKTYSGYIQNDRNQSMFFWLFEARNKPDTAPLVLWLSGGPGSSSMLGLFQENGPCRIKRDSSGLEDNVYSWSESANMLYLDQPIGVGFSYGTTEVTTSLEAAEAVYKVLQLFYADSIFSKFVGHDFGLWTGRYGPVMVEFFLKMNEGAPQTGNIIIPVKTLGIGNGLHSALVQYPEYMTYAKRNPYRQLIPDSDIENLTMSYNSPQGCRSLILDCQNTHKAAQCSAAHHSCNRDILTRASGKASYYDVRNDSPDPYPPTLEPLLTKKSFQDAIGAETNWTQNRLSIYEAFTTSGDWMSDSSPHLERVIDAGIRTFIGIERMMDNLNTKFSAEYRQKTFSQWVVAGEAAGLYKSAGSLSYLRVFGAGHKVPAYGHGKLARGQAASMFFHQIISGKPISG
ncbi:carboxypeptidase S1 [Melampsora larici-populina 98AG31]|uniref:Carboxypeptidase S1 n=1 Tax=Melampsora larici-populina (strain 98AG31 / pathotype 3-4-7) TaxID=747676 RepID=F4RIU7_MELLP|nr:carboxypeptidase S1 [Melampsora larici-populina 98AG31]EGG07771.1 carboxypeptidase S1 [Melampsora larici-populina 98AG31]